MCGNCGKPNKSKFAKCYECFEFFKEAKVGDACNVCKGGQVVEKTGRFGAFKTCSRWMTHPIERQSGLPQPNITLNSPRPAGQKKFKKYNYSGKF